MNAEAPDNRTPPAPPSAAPAATDDFAAIPILLEAVAEASTPESPASLDDVRAPRALGRADQQSLFDDPGTPRTVAPTPIKAPVRRTATASPERVRAAGHLLKARAPAIIDEVVTAHAARISDELRRRLQDELESLLAEMSGDGTPPGD